MKRRGSASLLTCLDSRCSSVTTDLPDVASLMLVISQASFLQFGVRSGLTEMHLGRRMVLIDIYQIIHPIKTSALHAATCLPGSRHATASPPMSVSSQPCLHDLVFGGVPVAKFEIFSLLEASTFTARASTRSRCFFISFLHSLIIIS